MKQAKAGSLPTRLRQEAVPWFVPGCAVRVLVGWLAVGPLFVFSCSYFSSEKGLEYDPRMEAPSLAAPSAPPMIGRSRRLRNPNGQAPAVRPVGFEEAPPLQLPVHISLGQAMLPPATTEQVNAAPVLKAIEVSSIETVLRLTEALNLQIALARKRVDEAVAAECNVRTCQLTQLLSHNCA